MTITKEEKLKQSAVQLGQKLALLIAVLFSKPEEQQAMLAVAEKMSPTQLMELIQTLETKYQEAFGKSIDEQYAKDVQAAVDQYQVEQSAADQEALSQLAALEKELKNEE